MVKPPTIGAVYQHFWFHHNKLQSESNGKATVEDAAKQTALSVAAWWKQKLIEVEQKSLIQITRDIASLHQQWRSMHKLREKESGKEVEKRAIFKQNLLKTFWVPSKNAENSLKPADKQFFNNMKTHRQGSILSIDKLETKRYKRKQTDKAKKETAKLRKVQTSNNVTLDDSDLDCDVSSDSTTTDPDFECSSKSIIHSSSKNFTLELNSEDCLATVSSVADEAQISHRQLMKLLSSICAAGGTNVDQVIGFSKETIRSARNNTRSLLADNLLQSALEEINQPNNFFVLHWDGKILKPLSHTQKKQEVIAVLLTSTVEDKEIWLNLEPATECGSINAETGAKHILGSVEKYNINKDVIIGISFDTTSVNTGVVSGIATQIQANFGHNLMWLPCRHHIFELCLKVLVQNVLGGTESPEEGLFKQLCRIWSNLNPKKFDIYEAQSRRMKEQASDVIDFCQKCLSNESTFQFREDYREVLELCLIFLGKQIRFKHFTTLIK